MHCHSSPSLLKEDRKGSIALVGQPNVGKSVIFQKLTGHYVTVSNYPGTTVEITRGAAQDFPKTDVIDTPGVISLPPHTEDEQITARVLLNEPLKAIVQVGDGKNLRRTLLLTTQLAELGFPMILALNMMDEAGARGVDVNHSLLAEQLGIPVVPTVAVRGVGIEALTQAILNTTVPDLRITYPSEIEEAIEAIAPLLPNGAVSGRSLALLWLCDDPVAQAWIQERVDAESLQHLIDSREALDNALPQKTSTLILQTRLAFVERLAKAVMEETGEGWQNIAERISQVAVHPLWGLAILGAVLYSLYWFVGIFGAGTLVDLLEGKLFGEIINPQVLDWVPRLLPIPLLAEFLVGEYGLWTMGITYALALILPIVTTFFLAFSIMEDTGYLPRLAVLTNRLFRMMGLNGKSVLPMILGLGCVTMATLTTRILESKRERILVILLLALAVPCSAQLGVVMGMLASISFSATLIWLGVVAGVMILIGWLAAQLIPGERSSLLVELPPLRWPFPSAVITKTLARLEWYLKEVVPLFLLGSGLLFGMDKLGILGWLTDISQPLITSWLGLPPEASAAFLLGFLRRDFGATGLFVMEAQGRLTAAQVLVAMVTITLFIPCIASVLMISKSRGWRTTLALLATIFPLAFFVGGLLNKVLALIGWGL